MHITIKYVFGCITRTCNIISLILAFIYSVIIMQVQTQLFCTGANYCDFIVYTKQSVHIERIQPDTSFWEANIEKAKMFFKTGIMPELLGRWFSRPPVSSPSTSSDLPSPSLETASTSLQDTNLKYCYCQEGEHGQMVACDNSGCPYQWFHLECLRLKSAPRSKLWYCPDCRKLEKFKKSK